MKIRVSSQSPYNFQINCVLSQFSPVWMITSQLHMLSYLHIPRSISTNEIFSNISRMTLITLDHFYHWISQHQNIINTGGTKRRVSTCAVFITSQSIYLLSVLLGYVQSAYIYKERIFINPYFTPCNRGSIYSFYRGVDKSLARPGRKQATTTKDFEFHISYI